VIDFNREIGVFMKIAHGFRNYKMIDNYHGSLAISEGHHGENIQPSSVGFVTRASRNDQGAGRITMKRNTQRTATTVRMNLKLPMKPKPGW
jgi:hypothetical protein